MHIVIVGGGIVGTAIAARLGETDHDVTLLERSTVGRETTAASAGIVMQSMVDPTPFDVDLRERARSVYRRLFEDGPLEWTRVGVLYVAETDAFAEQLELAAETFAECGLEASVLPATDLADFGVAPENFVGGLWTPNDRIFDPTAVARWFADCARRRGVDVRTDVAVTDLGERNGSVSGVEIDDDAEGRATTDTLAADYVLNATGPWAPRLNELAGVSLPLCHTLGPMTALETDAPVESPVTIFESERYVRPTREPDRTGAWVGAYRTGYVEGQSFDPDDLTVPAEFMAEATDLADAVPALEGARVVDEWVGLRTVTPDGRPIVGETALEGYLVACGFSGQGLTLAPAAAIVVSALLEGRLDDETRARLGSDRF
ncbi:FAD-binding oxidoreductase [Salinadaptatus halalkaliphilus]|uniref:FAD-binding oxidoreductase n=1 Tax=Salinadaptatus halalkaliphilus TaxID=2419781 RepID=A0A4S3TNN3_9EURY|nr:FAD-dependent oxidoreductase [Salinadaptatus halalkaliphilus]THE65902.1 FAD-binding oxidoreductase [Salinadaptatus halalkaliphilus]